MKNVFKISILLWMSIGMLVSCSKDDDGVMVDPKGDDDHQTQTDPPITLDCNYFKESRTLTKNPKAKVDYIITCVMLVRGDIVIEPGVVIEFEQNAGINLDDSNRNVASLSAKGTTDKPIIFRGVVKDKGFWRGIYFDSNNPKNQLDFVQIEDAGGKDFGGSGHKGGIVFVGGKLNLTNSIISNSQTYAINIHGNTGLVITNNKFTNNNAPLILPPRQINAINNTNDYSGNNEDFVYIKAGDINDIPVTTWQKINVPYRSNGFTIWNGYVDVEPGVVVEFDAGAKIKVYNYTQVAGFKAVGTPADPIIFTAINKVPGGWTGIHYFDSKHILNEIAFAEFHYSGGSADEGSVRLTLHCNLNIHDVTFKNIRNCAIKYSDEGGLTINNITLDSGACLKEKY